MSTPHKKILCTGSCGFIFGNFIRKAIYEKHPYSFVSVDRVNDSEVNSMYWNKNHIFHVADIRDQHIIDTIFKFEKPDIVIHGAAESSVDAAITDPNSFVTSNVLGTQVIINSCVKFGVEKLVYISTDEIGGQLESTSDASWTEECVPAPRNAYSASKYAGELLVKAAYYSHELQYNITRCSNNYGPRQTANKLIPRVIKSILNNEKIPVYGKGLQIRDWTHVFDNCSAVLKILEKGSINEIYNISANEEIQNIDVVTKICNVMGKGHDLIDFIPDPRNSHDFRYSVDSSKIRALGWKPNYKFKDGLENTIEWYNNNKYFLK